MASEATELAGVPVISWEAWQAQFDWQQGEHMSLVGPTGKGKTTLALALLDRRKYVCVIGCKPRDPALSALTKPGGGYRLVRSWPPHVDTAYSSRLVLWPSMRGVGDSKRQQRRIYDGLAAMFRQGGWAVYVDELRYVSDTLRLGKLLEVFWQMGRSLNISLIGGTQRPAHVPLMMYDQATHIFIWRDNDEANLKRIGGIGAIDSKTVREVVAQLPDFSFLYLNTRTGAMSISRVELADGA